MKMPLEQKEETKLQMAPMIDLDLLRRDTTPYAARIAELKSHHARVGFVACGQTIARLQGVGVEVELYVAVWVTLSVGVRLDVKVRVCVAVSVFVAVALRVAV